MARALFLAETEKQTGRKKTASADTLPSKCASGEFFFARFMLRAHAREPAVAGSKKKYAPVVCFYESVAC